MNDLETSADVEIQASTTRYPINLAELDYALGSRQRFSLSLASRQDRPLGPAGQMLHRQFCAAFGDSSV